MTRAADPLMQPLQLLREASLRPGFEQRLADCLSSVAAERKILRSSRWKYRRGILLLAALALPAGALAARGWFEAKHGAKGVSNSAQPLEPMPVRKPTVVTNVASPKLEQTPLLPSIEPSSSRDTAEAGERRKAAAPAKRDSAAKGAVRPSTNAAQPNVGTSTSSNVPAKIESLDVGIPRSGATDHVKAGAADKVNSATGLRSAASESVSRAAAARDRSAAERDRAGDHRGNDGAQQARERVQARERKGQ